MSINEKVLVIEGSSFMVNLMHRQVENGGFEVRSTSKPFEAMDIAHEWEPNVVLLDLDLPNNAAFELAEGLISKNETVKIIAYTSGDLESLGSRASSVGVYKTISKPIPKETLLDTLHHIFRADESLDLKKSKNVLESPATQPFEIHMKSCYICGHDHVKFFAPKDESHYEDWSPGLFPTYQAEGNYENWDFLKTMVTVCPRCLFASTDIRDFAEAGEAGNFPYKIDAKKLLTLGIGGRRKIAGVSPEVELVSLFDSPYRTKETVMKSFLLAEKCGNGLILGDKPGAHSDIGMLYTIRACLEKPLDSEVLAHAQTMFYDQLKIPYTSRDSLIKSYYFIIATHFALGESIKANEMKEELEHFYLEHNPEEASMIERLWNARLLWIWQNGLADNLLRDIH